MTDLSRDAVDRALADRLDGALHMIARGAVAQGSARIADVARALRGTPAEEGARCDRGRESRPAPLRKLALVGHRSRHGEPPTPEEIEAKYLGTEPEQCPACSVCDEEAADA